MSPEAANFLREKPHIAHIESRLLMMVARDEIDSVEAALMLRPPYISIHTGSRKMDATVIETLDLYRNLFLHEGTHDTVVLGESSELLKRIWDRI